VDTPQAATPPAGTSAREHTIRVNTHPHKWAASTISFEQVVSLAYNGNPPSGPNWVFTVDYRKGGGPHPQGVLEPGGSVAVQDGMVFDVTGTDKS
jgi:Multiubiquitin